MGDSKLKINDLLKILVESVADCLGGEYDLTSDDVPRIIFTCVKTRIMRIDEKDTVIDNRDMKISVVYLAATNQWKAFYPFPADKQERRYFDKMNDLIEWLYCMGVAFL